MLKATITMQASLTTWFIFIDFTTFFHLEPCVLLPINNCARIRLERGIMFRSFFNFLSQLTWVQKMILRWRIAWRVANRYNAGETPEEAIQVIRELNTREIESNLDHLGENMNRPGDAAQATTDILSLLEKINQTGVLANVSVKLTQIGLALGDELCKE